MKQAISPPTDKPWWRSARWQNGYLLATWLLLSAMPLIPLAFGRPQPQLMQIFVLEVLAWVIAWAALARPRYFQILLLPAFIALPIEIYLQLFFAQGISENSLGIMLETSPGETLEFLGSKIYLLLFIIAFIALWFGASMRWAWQSNLQVSKKVRVCLLWLVMLLLGSWVYHSTWAKSDKQHAVNQENTTLSLTHQPDNAFKQSWPFGIYRHLVEIFGYRYNIATLAEQNSHFRFGAYSTAPDKEQVIVLVLGESSRADRWSLNGYSRATNPLLQQESNLVNFPDFISPVTATRLSVPIIISRKPAREAMNDENRLWAIG
ncbi:MAG: DUF1705 domain-containing protein [Burkholderiales bacterium]|nr:DUF1705 domain-containing protein [Burkholderiales bacterium]